MVSMNPRSWVVMVGAVVAGSLLVLRLFIFVVCAIVLEEGIPMLL